MRYYVEKRRPWPTMNETETYPGFRIPDTWVNHEWGDGSTLSR